MGWFDEQIKQRKQADNEAFEDAFASITDSILGSRVNTALNNDYEKTKNAIDEILHYYRVKTREVPANVKGFDDQLEYLMRPHGIMRRTVRLESGWYKDAIGAMLGFLRETGEVVALLPTGLNGYAFYDPNSGEKVRLNRKTENLIEPEAVAFYKPFPLRKIGMKDLLIYAFGTVSMADIILFVSSTLITVLIGMIAPKITYLIYSVVVPSGSMRLLSAVAVFLISYTISSLMINAIKGIINTQIMTKMNISVSAATMMRVLSLPASFFKQFGSGELSAYTSHVNDLCSMLVSSVFTSGLTTLFSLVYITQIFKYAPALVVPALLIIIATVVFSVITTLVKVKYSKTEMELSAKENGMEYAVISGVQKVRLSGSEKRIFARWAKLYAKRSRLSYQPSKFLTLNGVIGSIITIVGMIVMYRMALLSGVSVAEYLAFDQAYGMVSGVFSALASTALVLADISPVLNMAKPILEAEPEVSEGKQIVTSLNGNIEVSNVSFRYQESMPLVVDNLSLKIKSGQYVAIVGTTGCGKSTLIRLMLGFEKPQKGAIFFDGKDINTLDLKSLHRKIGTVMQDGKLFQGDIFSNITISAPWLTMDDAWEAAEYAGIKEDIQKMPMGMFTLITEGSGGISGGQKQRLMIARAVAPKPKILIFDEATSALDNLTQKKVSDFLDQLKCTRIVIAHRLSTIRHCDRIIVLDKGKIIEDGTYEELMKRNGFFTELVKRQQIDMRNGTEQTEESMSSEAEEDSGD